VVDVLSVILRALSFVLLFQAAGVAIFLAVFGRRLADSWNAVRLLGQGAALAAVTLVAGHYALEAARMAGELSGVWDPSLQGMMWHSSGGAASILRLVGLGLIAVGLQPTQGRGSKLATLGAVLACLAFTLTGHTAVAAHREMLAPLLMIHLLVVAFWFGALAPLYLASSRETSVRACEIVEAFTGVATWLVPVILVAGVAMAVVLLPDLSALREPYGELLIAKVVGFAALMGLAAANKWRLAPALAAGTAESGRRFRRAVAAEYVLIVGVLAVTAVMTTFFSPEAG
jgi:putative copper resistance protein D